jgi:hypothetical protein
MQVSECEVDIKMRKRGKLQEREGFVLCEGGIALILARRNAKFDLCLRYLALLPKSFAAQFSLVTRPSVDSWYSGLY